LQHIRRGDIGTVADADEAGKPDIHALGIFQDTQPQRPALGNEGNVAVRRIGQGKGSIQFYMRVGIDQSHAIGADDTHAVTESQVHHFTFEGGAGLIFLTETIRNDDDAFHFFLSAFIHYGEHLGRRHGYNCQSTSPGTLKTER